MSIESDLAVLLRAEATVTGAVSGKTVTVYAGVAPQKTTAGVTVEPPLIQIVGLNRDFLNVLNPNDDSRGGLKKETIDIDCKGRTEREAGLIEDAVATYLATFTGTAGNSTVRSVLLEDCGSDTEAPEHGEGLPTFVKTLAAEVMYV